MEIPVVWLVYRVVDEQGDVVGVFEQEEHAVKFADGMAKLTEVRHVAAYWSVSPIEVPAYED